jgi:hypothetical protein
MQSPALAPVDNTRPGTAGPPKSMIVMWLGLAVVLAAAAVLSFDALRGLALAVSIPERFAWLLPIVVDAGAAVSCATWLAPSTPRDASRFAAGVTWSLLAVTVLGNAAQLGMHAEGIVPPWPVAVTVGAIAPAVVGAVVHLMVLIGRADRTTETAVRPAGPAQTVVEEIVPEVLELAAGADELLPKVLEWADRQTARPSQRQLRSEFGVGAERARKLMEQMEAAA